MNHGFCKINGDRILLAFIADAPIFEGKKDLPTHFLVQATNVDLIVGYSVVAAGLTGGFLYYPHQRENAIELTKIFNGKGDRHFECIPLAVGDKV